jgi:hypothetical protein
MQRPLKITLRDFPLSEAVEAEIRKKSGAMENYYARQPQMTVCAPAIKHHHKGGPFLVGIRLTVPGRELVVVVPRVRPPVCCVKPGRFRRGRTR